MVLEIEGGLYMFEVQFSLSVIMNWVKGTLKADNKSINVHSANTILGIIPAGFRDEKIPLRNVSSVSINNKFKAGNLIFGVLFVVFGFAMFGDSFFGGLFMLALGVLLVVSGKVVELRISRAGSDLVSNHSIMR